MKMLHTCIRVQHLDKSIAFYKEAFDFREKKKLDYPEHKFSIVYLGLEGDDYELELTYNYDHEPYNIGDGYGHIAIGVDEFEALHDKQVAAGFNVTDYKGLPDSSVRYYFITDPDGYKVEVIQNNQEGLMEKTTKRKLLFIGDSITDVGRNRNNPDSLGKGYVALIAKALADRGDSERYQLINRGISGNRILDIAERWHADCVSLESDVVTLLIGINDTWHNVGDETVFATEAGAEQFEMHYRHLLASLRKKSDARIILMEPFVFPYPEDRKTWRVDLDPKQDIVKRLATEFDAEWIGLDAYLNGIGAIDGYETLSNDGVHPTKEGHQLIADAWLKQFDVEGKK